VHHAADTDRVGATGELTVRDVVADLQRQWGSTFRANIIGWRLWANHTTRNLDRSTWAAAVTELPPHNILRLLDRVDSQAEQHLTAVTRSATLALETISATISEYEELRRNFEILQRRFESVDSSLKTRKAIIEAFIRDLRPLPHSAVVDPLEQLQNAEDIDHQ
jgi:hypothetical protein